MTALANRRILEQNKGKLGGEGGIRTPSLMSSQNVQVRRLTHCCCCNISPRLKDSVRLELVRYRFIPHFVGWNVG